MSKLSLLKPKKIAIDLGTANSLVYVLGQGLVLNEPTVVAITTDDNRVVAVGSEAKEMLGRTPLNIMASQPLKDGVIADYVITEAMLRYFVAKVLGTVRLFKPEIMLSVPAGVTSVETRAVLDAAISAGARHAFLIPEPLAAAIGANIPIADASGNMIVNIGGGTIEAAVISLGGLVVHNSVRVAGNRLDDSIQGYVRRKYNLLIGERTAEKVKIAIGTALPIEGEKKMEVKGRDSISGLPQTVTLSSREVTEAMKVPLAEMVAAVKNVLEATPPELASDVIDRGMVLSGGTALLPNLDKLFAQTTGIPAHRAEDPLFCVVNGISIALDNMAVFQKNLTRK